MFRKGPKTVFGVNGTKTFGFAQLRQTGAKRRNAASGWRTYDLVAVQSGRRLDQATERRAASPGDTGGTATCRGWEDDDMIFWLVPLSWLLIGLLGAFFGEA